MPPSTRALISRRRPHERNTGDTISAHRITCAGSRVAQRALSDPRIILGGGMLAVLLLTCVISLIWTVRVNSSLYYEASHDDPSLMDVHGPPPWPPSVQHEWLWFGGTKLREESFLSQCLLGGLISLTIGIAAASISVFSGGERWDHRGVSRGVGGQSADAGRGCTVWRACRIFSKLVIFVQGSCAG